MILVKGSFFFFFLLKFGALSPQLRFDKYEDLTSKQFFFIFFAF